MPHRVEQAGKAGILRIALFVAGVNLLHNDPDFESAEHEEEQKIIHISAGLGGVALQCLLAAEVARQPGQVGGG